MKKILLALLILIALCSTLYFLSTKDQRIDPNVPLTLLDGRKLRFADLQGKPLVVVFWATSCSTCMLELPKLAKMKNGSFEVLAVAMGYDEENLVRQYQNKNQLPFLLVHDVDATLSKAFNNIKVTPTSFILDKDGNIKTTVLGAELDAAVGKLM